MINEAIDLYFHRSQYMTDAMREGRLIHKEVEDYVREHNSFPEWISPFKLKNPIPEHRIVVAYNDLWDMSAVIDVLDNGTIFELKTGKTDSSEWIKTYQLPFYFLACKLANIPVNKAFLIHHNQHIKQNDWSMLWNSDYQITKARNYIDSVAPEIYQHFLQHGLLVS